MKRAPSLTNTSYNSGIVIVCDARSVLTVVSIRGYHENVACVIANLTPSYVRDNDDNNFPDSQTPLSKIQLPSTVRLSFFHDDDCVTTKRGKR
ncbi:hypothetical protein KAZ93_00935 [Patescibacteria group bacterium]|nr:hypothetical protein [Patescibacteria group bacterium]